MEGRGRLHLIRHTIENEPLKGVVFNNMKEVKAALSVAVDFHTHERMLMPIDRMIPVESAGSSGEKKRQWPRYRLIAIKSRPESLTIAGNGLPSHSVGEPIRAAPSSQPLRAIRRNE
jgi:hypothetical protein